MNLGLLSSPYIVGYIDSFMSGKDVNIIMEYCENGDLDLFIQKSKGQIKDNVIWKYFIQICIGLYEVHRKGFIHRDLKPENIFLTDNFKKIKIGDLGLACKVEQNPSAESRKNGTHICDSMKVGTPYYVSPEVWRSSYYTQKTDMWSLGIILHKLCFNCFPFQVEEIDDLVELVTNGTLNLFEGKKPEKELHKIISQLLRKNPEARPSVQEILQFTSVRKMAKILKIILP